MGSRPIGRTSRVSGFTMRPRVSTAPSKGASSRSPRTTGEVPVRRAISKRASETARTMTVVLAAIDPQGGTGHLHFGLTGTSEFGRYVTRTGTDSASRVTPFQYSLSHPLPVQVSSGPDHGAIE